MDYKVGLHNMKGWSQFFFFCFISFCGMLLGTIAVFVTVNDVWEGASHMRMGQLIQIVSVFMLPAIVFAYLCQNDPRSYLKINTFPHWQFLGLAVLLILIIQPFIYLVNYYNQQLVLPDSFVGLEKWIQQLEEIANKSLELFLADKSAIGIISNILIIAVVAGLAEELFFRGCLLQIIRKIVSNRYLAVWITAVIFSAIHFQFYGFLPRLLLGALLGYLFIWSGSLWIAVIAHTFHNAINVVLLEIYFGTPDYDKMENLNINNHMWIALLSLVFSILILFSIYKLRVLHPSQRALD